MTLVQAMALLPLSMELLSIALSHTLVNPGTSCQGVAPGHVIQMGIGLEVSQLASVSMHTYGPTLYIIIVIIYIHIIISVSFNYNMYNYDCGIHSV